MLRATVNGESHEFPRGCTTLQAIRLIGIDIPTLRLTDGEKVKLVSAHCEAVVTIRLNPAVNHAELFTTFHTAEVFLNNLTSPCRDKQTLAPDYKVTAVKVEKR